MTDPILVACAYCRRSTLPYDLNGLLCAVCLVPYVKGAWRSRASEGDYAERLAPTDGFIYHDEPKLPETTLRKWCTGCKMTTRAEESPNTQPRCTRCGWTYRVVDSLPDAPRCTRCGYASCNGDPCAVFGDVTVTVLSGDHAKRLFGPSEVADVASAAIARDKPNATFTINCKPVTGVGSVEYFTASANIPAVYSDKSPPADNGPLRSRLVQEGRQRERADMELRLAWALFRERVTPEAKLRAERNRNVESVVRTMWNTTRTGDRDECLARAAALFTAMLASLPKEEGPF